MAKSSGSDRYGGGIGNDGGGNYKMTIKNKESLKNMKNRELQREIQQGIAKYESRLGIRTRNIMLADLQGAYGAHVTANGESEGIYLNKRTFKNGTVKKINSVKEDAYKSGFLTRTNKPVQHTIVHELGHATWNSHLKSANAIAAGKSIKTKYQQFLKENPKAYGRYSKSNVNEFWAEVTTKAVLGRNDKYTRFVKNTIKKYKL
ncbi:hypothetical protein ACF3N7_05295 [Cruoricaptor ignavus]|uniref:hypothetical protein n=1 Tax=Cruoricaptor ignavus TaxID=1118202 RepID=UPI00370D2C3F